MDNVIFTPYLLRASYARCGLDRLPLSLLHLEASSVNSNPLLLAIGSIAWLALPCAAIVMPYYGVAWEIVP